MNLEQDEQGADAASTDEAYIAETALEMARFSLDEEMRRERALITQSGWMITGFSALSIVVATLIAGPYFEAVFTNQTYLFVALTLFFILIMTTLLLAICAQWRNKRIYPDSPLAVYDYFLTNKHEFDRKGAAHKQADLFNSIQKSVQRLNNRRKLLLNISCALFIAAISLLLVLIFIPEFSMLLNR